MIITLKCNVSLSKKMRALARSHTKFNMLTGTLVNGVGEGSITFEADDNVNFDDCDLFNKETSIIIVPLESREDDQNVIDQSQETQETNRVTNLFMNNSNVEEDAENPVIRKIGAVKPPENKKQNSTSIKHKQQIEEETPAPFKATQNPAAKRYITNMNQLLEAIRLAENKKSNVNPDSIKNPRLRAVAMEEKEKAEAIDYPALVVNDSCAVLTINDLGISLSLNTPYNLNNISAKRLANSKELQSMFRANLVKFIRPDQLQEYMDKVVEADRGGLEVYDNRRQAEAAIGEMGESKSHMQMVKISEENELSLKELDGPTENEKILNSLPPRIETNDNSNNEDGTIVTSHMANGGMRMRSQRDITSDSVENSKGIKSIRRSGIQFN